MTASLTTPAVSLNMFLFFSCLFCPELRSFCSLCFYFLYIFSYSYIDINIHFNFSLYRLYTVSHSSQHILTTYFDNFPTTLFFFFCVSVRRHLDSATEPKKKAFSYCFSKRSVETSLVMNTCTADDGSSTCAEHNADKAACIGNNDAAGTACVFTSVPVEHESETCLLAYTQTPIVDCFLKFIKTGEKCLVMKNRQVSIPVTFTTLVPGTDAYPTCNDNHLCTDPDGGKLSHIFSISSFFVSLSSLSFSTSLLTTLWLHSISCSYDLRLVYTL